MDLENKAGKTGTTATGEGNQPGTSTGNGGNGSGTPADQSAKIAELEARLAKEVKDKEIYRAGLLAAKNLGGSKSKIKPEDLADPEKLDSAIEAKIQEKDLEQKALQEATAKAAEEERLRAENDELRRSLAAAQSAGYSASSVGSGHSENSESKPQGYWSDAQRDELRQIYVSRNMYTQEQIERMVTKAEEIARTKTATSDRKNDLVKTRQY